MGIKYKRRDDTSNEEASKKLQLNVVRPKISLNRTLSYLVSHPQGCRGDASQPQLSDELRSKERKEGKGRWIEGRFRK